MNVLGQKVTAFYYSSPFKAPLREVSYSDLGGLEKGSRSVVRKVKSSLDDQKYALKIGKIEEGAFPGKNEKCRREFDREVRMLTLLNEEGSEYVVQLIAFFILGKKPVLLLPLYKGDLYNAIDFEDGFSFGKTRLVVKDLLNILIFLKKYKVIHRDIKPENIFLTFEGGLRLGDFGLACLQGDAEPKKLCGTLDCVSPEQLKDPENADFSSDLWAVACVALFACSGENPISVNNRGEIESKQLSAVNSLDRRLRKIFLKKEDRNLEEFDLVKDALKHMLVLNPQERITAEEALTRIQS